MNELITGHEAEMKALSEMEWSAKDRAKTHLKEALRILSTDGPSLKAQLFPDDPDPDGWQIEAAIKEIEKAKKALSE